MVNSIPTLATVADCDHQLELAQRTLIVMQFERNQVDQKNANAVTSGPSFERELQSTKEQIAAYEATLPTMAAGPGKEDLNSLLQKLYVKHTSLLRKEGSFGIDGLFEQQGAYTALGGKIDSFQTFIAALNARRAQL